MLRTITVVAASLVLSASASLAFAQSPSPSPSRSATASPTAAPTITPSPTPAPTVPALGAPTNLSVDFFFGPILTEPLQPRVSWLAVPGAIEYQLELSATDTAGSRDFKLINLVPAAPTDTGYVRYQSSRSFARQQCYRVRAIGAGGVVGPYSEAFCLPLALAPTSRPGATPLPPSVGSGPASDDGGSQVVAILAVALLALSPVVAWRALRR